MATELKIEVNGQVRPVSAAPDTPLLYVLMNDLGLQSMRIVFRSCQRDGNPIVHDAGVRRFGQVRDHA